MRGLVKRLGSLLTLLVCTGMLVPAMAQTPAPPEFGAMTWPDLRASIAAGHSRVIIPTGGIEQNGPHMALDKHDRIVSFAAREIATRLGNTHVAPVVSFVPQGAFEPPFGNLRFPGTLGISEQAFDGVIDGLARSLKAAGFTVILLIGDHGMSQPVQQRVAQRLSREWRNEGVRVIHVEDYYVDHAQIEMLKRDGFTESAIGSHAGMLDTSELMAIAPGRVDLKRLKPAPSPLGELGASGEPQRSSAELGRRLIEIRIAAAVAAIRKELGLR